MQAALFGHLYPRPLTQGGTNSGGGLCRSGVVDFLHRGLRVAPRRQVEYDGVVVKGEIGISVVFVLDALFIPVC